MNKDLIIKIATFLVIVIAFVSCDDDFNSVGSEVIGGVGFEGKNYTSSPVVYNKKLSRVQTSGVSNYWLGFYNDPVYGISEYGLLSQITPRTLEPEFGKNPVLDSVVLTIPYFSSIVESKVENDITVNTYELDSVYADTDINLQLYRSDYFLRDFDPTSEFEESQIYYSNDIANFGQGVLEATPIATISGFMPSEDEVILPIRDVNGLKSEVDKEKDSILEVQRLSPRLRFKLPNDLFKSWIIDQEGSPELSNISNFKNYFRGFYIKPERIGDSEDANLFLLDILNAATNITMFYSSETDKADAEDVDQDGDVSELLREQETLSFIFNSFTENTFNAISINGINNVFDITVPEPNTEKGDESLYLKGGEGSYAIVELFNRYVETDENGDYVLDTNGNPIFKETPVDPSENDKTELDLIRSQNWLVNNAVLRLYVDREKMIAGGDTEPERIYIFNAETGQRLVDFCGDPTFEVTDPNNKVIIHLGRLNRGSDKRGEFYEINLTRHIINLINENNDVQSLGITVSQNVGIESQATTASGCGATPALIGNEDDAIPLSSVLSPEGTIIYGNIESVPEEKRLQLEISYSKSTRN